jgi:hypothetical protein
MLYQHDNGDSYDGDPINSYFETPWYTIDNNYLTNKRLLWMDLTYTRYGNWNLQIDHGIDWSTGEGSHSVDLNPDSQTALWDVSNWDEGTWSGEEVTTETLRGDWGTGHAFNFKFSNNGANQAWLIQGFDLFAQALSPQGRGYQHR